jgi:ABC-type multidrug transport system fused ATPase/permease subunit
MPRYLRFIFRLAREQRGLMSALFAFLVFGVAARLTEPYIYKVIVDTLSNGLKDGRFDVSQIHTLMYAVGIWFVLALIMNVMNANQSHLTWRIGIESSQRVQMMGYKRLLDLDYAEHSKTHSSRYAKIVDDADNSTWEMTNWWLSRFASAGLGFIGMLAIALSVSWQMTLVAVSVLPPGLWLIIRHMNKYENEQRRANKLWEEKHEHLSDQVSNIVTYKLNPHESVFLDRHREYVDRAQSAQSALNKKWRFVEMMNPDAFARFLVLSLGIFFVKDGSITLGTLFMFMGLLNEILTPLHLLGDILPQYTRRAQHIERLLALFDKEDTVSHSSKGTILPEIRGEVKFENVFFSYPLSTDVGFAAESDLDKGIDPDDAPDPANVPIVAAADPIAAARPDGFALQNISFDINPGETVALVGHSGSGKTTMMSLVNRLVDPTSGRITIDGIDLKEFALHDLKRHVGTVLQENSMYNETVAANIAYGDPTASREAIVRAATQANANGFIDRLPKKYDTLIGERGVRLSGGEKQRVAIARAMLKNPAIVVLDEPTSALDSITEMRVQEGLDELMKGRTTLIIAHRLSTVRHANRIIVLDQGVIIGQGPHEELVKTCPTYKEMVDLQIGGFLADE